MFILADLDTTENVRDDQMLLDTKLTTTINTEDLCYLRDQLKMAELYLRGPLSIYGLHKAHQILTDLLKSDDVF